MVRKPAGVSFPTPLETGYPLKSCSRMTSNGVLLRFFSKIISDKDYRDGDFHSQSFDFQGAAPDPSFLGIIETIHYRPETTAKAEKHDPVVANKKKGLEKLAATTVSRPCFIW